jgi:NTE family protein
VVLVSDGGAPFEFTVGTNPIRRLLRYTSMVTYQTRSLRLRALFADWNAQRYAGTYWSLTSGVVPSGVDGEPYRGYSQGLAREVLSRVRTDLDCFDAADMAVLENHEYYAAERALGRHLPATISAGEPYSTPPYPEWVDEGKVRRALRNSHRRVLPRRLLRGILQGP